MTYRNNAARPKDMSAIEVEEAGASSGSKEGEKTNEGEEVDKGEEEEGDKGEAEAGEQRENMRTVGRSRRTKWEMK